ncbi:hypothetical protein RQP46_006543 [Phenoliferia psychrophenolica]
MRTLEQHLADLEIRLDEPGAKLSRDPSDGSYAVLATTHIPSLAVVASAPKSATLSPRTSALAPHLASLPTELAASPTLALASCVLYESLLGAQSRWSVYLAHLPRDVSAVAGIWASESAPMQWVRGTELEREIARVGVSHSTLSALYSTLLLPFLTPLLPPSAPEPTLDLFLAAYAHVTSRAFLIDTFHRLALVPLFDLFNHSTDSPHVHLESHEWVCAICGHWSWCEHERDDDPAGAPTDATTAPVRSTEDEDERIELVAHADVAAGTEIFNTYGEALSNARLLIEYGFLSEANPWDVSIFSLDEVLGRSSDLSEPTLLVRALVRQARGEDDSGDGPLTAAAGREGGEIFFDADAKVSVALWCALVCRHGGARGDDAGLHALLDECWDDAQELEEEEGDDEMEAMKAEGTSEDRMVLDLVARDIINLARGRRTDARVHRPDLSPADLLALADEETDRATHLALEFAAGERLRLLCVEERWSNLRRFLSIRR